MMKFYIHTLGCKVNLYESGVIRDILLNEKYEETDEENADVIIINTCSVTNTADHKSKKAIQGAKRKNKDAILVVMGCFSQVNEDIQKDLDVDVVLGNKDKTKIISYINEAIQKKRIVHIEDVSKIPFETMKLNNFNKTRAFVKIEDGCDNYCSYCIIPYTRGNVRSKKKQDVINEVIDLVRAGHKEVVLTGIHTGHYIDGNYKFYDLLKDLVKVKGLERLRISSIEMNEITDEIIELFKNNTILVDHLHIPLQSGSDEILKRMNRKYNKRDFIEKIEKIRKVRPLISITTDVIVGFPGETDELFKETIDTIKKIKFSKIHVFPFSRRKGTPADLMKDQVDEKVKKQRVHELLDLSKKLEIEYMTKFLGKELTYIKEIEKDGFFIGHTGNYLQVKTKEPEKVLIEKIEYPYIIGGKV